MAAFRHYATCATLLFGLAGGAHAAVLYDNTGVNPTAPYGVDSGFGMLGDSFTVPAGGATVNTVSMLLDNAGDPIAGGMVEVDIQTDSGTSPGGIQQTLGFINDSQLSANPTLVGFTGVNAALGQGRYWVTLTDVAFNGTDVSSNIEWSYDASNNPGTGTGVPGEFNTVGGPSFANTDSGPFIMCVDTTGRECVVQQNALAAPEPAGLTVLGLALAGLGLIRRRRNG